MYRKERAKHDSSCIPSHSGLDGAAGIWFPQMNLRANRILSLSGRIQITVVLKPWRSNGIPIAHIYKYGKIYTNICPIRKFASVLNLTNKGFLVVSLLLLTCGGLSFWSRRVGRRIPNITHGRCHFGKDCFTILLASSQDRSQWQPLTNNDFHH